MERNIEDMAITLIKLEAKIEDLMSQKKAFKHTNHDAKTVLNETKSEAKHLKSYHVTKMKRKCSRGSFRKLKLKTIM